MDKTTQQTRQDWPEAQCQQGSGTEKQALLVAFLTTQQKVLSHQQCLLQQGYLLHDISQCLQVYSSLQQREPVLHACTQALERYHGLMQEHEMLLREHQQAVQELMRNLA